MICKNCKIEIVGKTNICPLCHTTVEENPTASQIYPTRKKRKRPAWAYTFDAIFIGLSILVCLSCCIVEGLIWHSVHWSAVIAFCLFYIYLLIRNAILSNQSTALKIFIQLVVITLFMIMTSYIFENIGILNCSKKTYVVDYGLPITIIICNLVLITITLMHISKDPTIIVESLIFSCIGFVPLILYFAQISDNIITTSICCAISIISILTLLILSKFKIFEQFRKKFHI